jgi:PKHD-type hydroxylase
MSNFDFFYIENFLNKKQIKQLLSFIEKNFDVVENKEHQSSDKKTTTLCILYSKIKNMLNNIEHQVNYINERNFGYSLNTVNDFSYVLLNKYFSKDKGEYPWHNDSSRSNLFDCKLTVQINLSDEEYEGGEFLLCNPVPYVVEKFKPGTLLIFKSFLNHKVNPVTKGSRKTLTMFFNGPPLR